MFISSYTINNGEEMKKILSLIIFISFVFACKSLPEGNEISAEELNTKIDKGEKLIIIDVAEPDEYADARLENAINIPIMTLKDNIEKKLPEISKDDEIVLYCYSGMRSAIGVEKLKELGFTNVVSLVGGISNWKKNGLPFETDN